MKILFDNLLIGQDFPVLGEKDIHLWRISINPSKEILTSCMNALSASELSRLEFFEFDSVKKNYSVSQGIIRILLGAYLGIKPNEVQLGRHSKGKPFCIQDPSLFFNISNSGQFCVLAFSRTNEVGIDLEFVRPLTDLEEMIEKNFKTEEQNYITKIDKEKLRRFYLFWTIKESYLKAIGEGMRIEPQNLEFSIHKKEIKLIGVSGYVDENNWIFKEMPFDPEYVRTLTFIGDSMEFLDFEIA